MGKRSSRKWKKNVFQIWKSGCIDRHGDLRRPLEDMRALDSIQINSEERMMLDVATVEQRGMMASSLSDIARDETGGENRNRCKSAKHNMLER